MRISLQFHGSRSEVYTMARGWASTFQLALAVEVFFPTYQVTLIGGDALVDGSAVHIDDIDRISIGPAPIDLSVSSTLDYSRKNPDLLFILLGKQSETILRETVISGMTEDPTLARTWRRLRDQARRSMSKGMLAENVVSGAQAKLDSRRYTAEAKRLADTGVKLVSGTDGIRYWPQ